MQAVTHQQFQTRPYYGDSWLIILAMLLVFVGLIMMTSASVEIGESLHRDPIYYFKRQLIFILLGLVGAIITFQIPLLWWQKGSYGLFIITLLLLSLVLVPGVGYTAGGGTRWINIGFMTLQVSEPSKILIVFFMAGLLSRQHELICNSLKGF